MKRRVRILIFALVVLICAPALGEGTVYDAFGELFTTEDMLSDMLLI